MIVGVATMPLAGWLASFLRNVLEPGATNPQIGYVVLEDAPAIATFAMATLIVVALPFAEEVLYRGVLYDALERVRGPGLVGRG